MARRSSLRASDSDREQIADRLRNATAEGRLLAEELEERLTVAFKARTYGELDALVSDLPPGKLAPRERSSMHLVPRAFALVLAAVVILAVLAMAAVIITSVLAVWMVWAVIGWWFFGRRRHHYARSYRRYSGPTRSGNYRRCSGPPRSSNYRARYGTWRA
jgi:Domain of unknown function (DUF1707)